jgi:hypothetical protein
MKRQKITFKNSFHGTEASSYLNNEHLNATQVRSLNKKLCGVSGCCCGGIYRSRAEVDGLHTIWDSRLDGSVDVMVIRSKVPR